MEISERALELERMSIGGAPTLAAAFEIHHHDWLMGTHGREVSLHLNFLAWYLIIEAEHLTGFADSHGLANLLASVFRATHDWLLPDGDASSDSEALYVTGLAAEMFPWALGDVNVWMRRATRYRIRYRELLPAGISPSVFEGRGAYGDYFAGHARAGF
jgi:hypothetical protein